MKQRTTKKKQKNNNDGKEKLNEATHICQMYWPYGEVLECERERAREGHRENEHVFVRIRLKCSNERSGSSLIALCIYFSLMQFVFRSYCCYCYQLSCCVRHHLSALSCQLATFFLLLLLFFFHGMHKYASEVHSRASLQLVLTRSHQTYYTAT